MIPKLKEKASTTLRAVLVRRHVILCAAAVLVVAVAIWLLLPMLPRTAKPRHYNVGELSIQAITEVVGYRKVTAVSQSLSGTGRAEAGSYTYKAGKQPRGDVESYYTLLHEEYSAELSEESQMGDSNGKLLIDIPTEGEETVIKMEIEYSPERYLITVDEKLKPREKPTAEHPVNVTPEQARELVLSLTKQETGFKADVSVYTTNLEEETVIVDEWEYYVFTVVADYSETRIEYRGTFYVGCTDGIVLSYDKETGTTSRLRGPQGSTEQAEQDE